MTKEELEQLMGEARSIQTDIARFLTKGQDILTHWDDFTPEARTRIGNGLEEAIGRAQVSADRIPNFRGRA